MEPTVSVGEKNSRVKQLEAVQAEAKELFRKKNADYGDAFATYGTVGILVRLGDKIHRLQSITSKGINLIEDEKLRDTLIDLHNYAAMGILLLDSGENSDHPSKNKADCIKEWYINGSTNKYKMQRIESEDGSINITCSCPSYKYCKDELKTCKHTNQHK